MKPIIILDAFVTDKQEEATLLNFINSIKTTGDDLLLMSNTTTSKEVQDKVDYFFYDKKSLLDIMELKPVLRQIDLMDIVNLDVGFPSWKRFLGNLNL